MAKSKTKAIISFIGGVLIAGIVLATAVGSSWYTNPDISTWFNGWGKGVEAVSDEADGSTIITEGESNGIRLISTYVGEEDHEEYGISAQTGEEVYTLTATYIPEDTTHQETTYTISFQDPESTWATGKVVTDYATVTQASAGSTTATLTVLQAFSEPIIVTATSNRNNNINATVTVHYCGYYPLTVTHQLLNGTYKTAQRISNSTDMPDRGLYTFDAVGLCLRPSLIDGTVAPSSWEYYLTIVPTDFSCSVLTSVKSLYSGTLAPLTSIKLSESLYFNEDTSAFEIGSVYDFFTAFAKGQDDYDEEAFRKALDTALYRAGDSITFLNAAEQPLFELSCDAVFKYPGVYTPEVIKQYNNLAVGRVYVSQASSWGALEVQATDISMSDTVILAGTN